MFLWRSLSPAAIVACFASLASKTDRKTSERAPETAGLRVVHEDPDSDRLEKAAMEINARL